MSWMSWAVVALLILVGWAGVYLMYRAGMRQHVQQMREAGLRKYLEKEE